MGDPRVQERDNPLVRKLNAIQRINEESGSALGGGVGRGSGAPMGPVTGGVATVLPPPARPITAIEALEEGLPPEDSEALEREWAMDPSNPANQRIGDAAPEIAPGPQARAEVPVNRPMAREFMRKRIIIDVQDGAVYTGDSFIALMPAEVEAVRDIAIRAMREEMEKKIAAMRAAWEPKVEQPTEAVPTVPAGETTGEVSPGTTGVPPVLQPVAAKAGKRRKVQRKVAGKSPKTETKGSDAT